MTTSGTSTFNLNVLDIIEEAFERNGKEVRTGYDLRTARRSLNLLFTELANRGINLWTIEEGSIPLYSGTFIYDLPVDTVDLLDQVIRTGTGQNQTDIAITRISGSTYSTIPNKNATGRPIQVWVHRRSGATYPVTGAAAPQVYVWPSPDQGTISVPYYTLVYWRLRRMNDAGNGEDTQDIPFRYLNVLIAGLSYYLAMKLPDIDPGRRAELRNDYEFQLDLANQEDREKADARFVPRINP